jgi:hypothetical protein
LNVSCLFNVCLYTIGTPVFLNVELVKYVGCFRAEILRETE